MNIFFSCSITGGRDDQRTYQAIVKHLEHSGHTLPTAHLAQENVLELEDSVSAQEIFQRDIDWLLGCDGLIAEVSTPSHGVGYEIAFALSIGKPVLCLHQQGRRVSKMISGNSHPLISLGEYSGQDELFASIDHFLDRLHEHKE